MPCAVCTFNPPSPSSIHSIWPFKRMAAGAVKGRGGRSAFLPCCYFMTKHIVGEFPYYPSVHSMSTTDKHSLLLITALLLLLFCSPAVTPSILFLSFVCKLMLILLFLSPGPRARAVHAHLRHRGRVRAAQGRHRLLPRMPHPAQIRETAGEYQCLDSNFRFYKNVLRCMAMNLNISSRRLSTSTSSTSARATGRPTGGGRTRRRRRSSRRRRASSRCHTTSEKKSKQARDSCTR